MRRALRRSFNVWGDNGAEAPRDKSHEVRHMLHSSRLARHLSTSFTLGTVIRAHVFAV
jgi:hypothetical protein